MPSKPRDHSNRLPTPGGAAARPSSIMEVEATIYDAIARVDAGRVVSEPINIFEIIPDATQPRRTLPSELRALWDGTPNALPALYESWLNAVHQERGNLFPLDAYLQGDEEERAADTGPLEAALLRLLELAASIYRDGLTNPISVAPAQGSLNLYRLETGERRWMAYHLLHARFQDERWLKIPARTVDAVNPWRQASENNARANLNGYGKARQFAVLLMDLLTRTEERHFKSFEEIISASLPESAYYAQVADGHTFSIPKGKSELLVNAMGVKHPDQLKQFRRLLRQPDYLWQIADDLDWSETFIRDILEKNEDNPDKLYAAVMEAAHAQGYAGNLFPLPVQQTGNKFAESGDTDERIKQKRSLSLLERQVKQIQALDPGVLRTLDPRAKVRLRSILEEHKRWLSEVETLLRD